MVKPIPAKIVGVRKDTSKQNVEYISILISKDDAVRGIKNKVLKVFTESQHGVQKPVIVKSTGRATKDSYLTTTGDPSESNNLLDQPEV